MQNLINLYFKENIELNENFILKSIHSHIFLLHFI